MTCLATKLKGASYRTIAAGKWHAGMETLTQTPRGRGYDAALTYFNPDNGYWSSSYSSCPTAPDTPVIDLWEAVEGGGQGPAFSRNNSCPDRTFIPNNGCMDELGRRCAAAWNGAAASAAGRAACVRCAMQANITACGAPINQSLVGSAQQPSAIIVRWCAGYRPFTTGAGCRAPSGGPAVYEDQLFSSFAARKVQEHPDTNTPLFVFFAPHSAHTPLQAQESTLSQFDFISQRDDKPEHTRQTYTAMVAEGDRAIGTVVAAFRERGLWDRTLFVYSSGRCKLGSSAQSLLSTNSALLARRQWRAFVPQWHIRSEQFSVARRQDEQRGGYLKRRLSPGFRLVLVFDTVLLLITGGIRVASFVAGGVVPAKLRGSTFTGLVAIYDWCTMAMLPLFDRLLSVCLANLKVSTSQMPRSVPLLGSPLSTAVQRRRHCHQSTGWIFLRR